MRTIAIFVVAILLGSILGGCNAPLEDKYQDGRDKQKAKADKMIEDQTSSE